MGRICKGCGIELQTMDKEKNGYIPLEVTEERDEQLCMRCFKIRNYNSFLPVTLTAEEYKEKVSRVIREVDVVVYIVDIIDFEASFDDTVMEVIGKKPVIVAVNKIDLIPDKKHPSEVAEWIRERLKGKKINILDIAVLSVKRSYGVNGVIRKIKNVFKEKAKIGVMGVTNVGKSSFINNLFNNEGGLTVSAYAGTTLSTVKKKIHGTDYEIIDTPGIIPVGRISDLVCEKCNVKLVPSKEISRMTFKLKKDKVLMLGGLVSLKVLNEGSYSPIFVAFASKEVKYHTTSAERYNEVLEKHSGDWIIPPCGKCKDEYYSQAMKKEVVTVEAGEDIVFKGLGWISVRRGPLVAEVTMPEMSEYVIRKAFIIPKDRESEEI